MAIPLDILCLSRTSAGPALMAAGWFRQLGRTGSAGVTTRAAVLSPAAPTVDSRVVAAMARQGIDLSPVQPVAFATDLIGPATVVVTVGDDDFGHLIAWPPGSRSHHLDCPAWAPFVDAVAMTNVPLDAVCAALAEPVRALLSTWGIEPLPDTDPFDRPTDLKVLSRQRAYDGFIPVDVMSLSHRRYDGSWSPALRRELAVRPEAIGVLLYDPVLDQVILVKQFRTGLVDDGRNPWVLEVVAGLMLAGEAPIDVVKREAKEEANVDLTDLLFICEYHNSPGWSNEKISLFCARVDASQAGGVHGLDEEHEDILVVPMSLEAALTAVREGEIHNAMTLIALQWLALHRDAVKQQWGAPLAGGSLSGRQGEP